MPLLELLEVVLLLELLEVVLLLEGTPPVPLLELVDVVLLLPELDEPDPPPLPPTPVEEAVLAAIDPPELPHPVNAKLSTHTSTTKPDAHERISLTRR
jgi:hypothetical protein